MKKKIAGLIYQYVTAAAFCQRYEWSCDRQGYHTPLAAIDTKMAFLYTTWQQQRKKAKENIDLRYLRDVHLYIYMYICKIYIDVCILAQPIDLVQSFDKKMISIVG